MKKTLTINISGTIFHIDEDAYEKLQDYLLKLNNHYSSTDEGREIISDIELRIAEIFNEKLQGTQVVNIDLVTDVITTMGTPEDIFEEDEETTTKTTPPPHTEKIRRRLYRDPDHRIIGGVTSGLANYLGIDIVIMRLIFLILFFVYGLGFLPYIILWIVVPKARTTSQKLEMHGKKVNVSNIEGTIKEEYEEVKESFNNLRNKHGKTTQDGIDRIIDFLGTAIRLFLKIAVIVVGVFFLIAGISGLVAFIVGSSFSSVFISDNFINELFLTGFNLTLFQCGVFIVAVIPILLIVFTGFKILFRFKTNNKAIGFSALLIWILGLALIITIAVKQAISYKHHVVSPAVTHTLKNVATDTLYLKSVDNVNFEISNTKVHFNAVRMVTKDDKDILIGEPTFDIKKSNTKNLELRMKKEARGNSRKEAMDFARNIKYNWNQNDSLINFNHYFNLEDKWQDQELHLTLKVPVGKVIYIDESMENIIHDIENVDGVWYYDMLNKYWMMTKEGLKQAE